jgi:hypothetical protein
MKIEYIKLTNDNNYVPSKWAVIQASLTGSNSGWFWVKRISYGITTEQNLNDYIDSLNSNTLPDKTKLDGVLGEYRIVGLNEITEYKRNSLRTEKMPVSKFPIG